MWERTNPDQSAAGGHDDDGPLPGDPVASEPAAEPAVSSLGGSEGELEGQSAQDWTPHHFPAQSAARVFSALASVSTGAAGAAVAEEHAPNGNGAVAEAEAEEPPGQLWSPEAAEARRRAQQRWREMQPPALMPALTVPVDRGPRAQLLGDLDLEPEDEFDGEVEGLEPAAPAPAAPATTVVAPWLPAHLPAEAPAPTRFGPPGRRRWPNRSASSSPSRARRCGRRA